MGEKFPRVVGISLVSPGPYFIESYALNSANNGPWGDAITKELMPYLEKTFRLIDQPYGRIVEGASTGGWEALAIAARQPVALALLDVRMPNLDGIETLRRLRSQAKTTHLPVVMMTASPGMQDEQVLAIEQLGATLLLGKNLSPQDLAGVISHRILAAEPEPVVPQTGPAGREPRDT